MSTVVEKETPGYIGSQDRIGDKKGDMTIISVGSRTDEKTGWTIPTYTVKCDVCNIERQVDAKTIRRDEGTEHGRGCVKAAVEQADQMIGKTYGDMKIIDKDFYIQGTGKPINNFIVKCNVCGGTYKTIIGPLLSGEKCHHEDFCIPAVPKDLTSYIGKDIGDMHVISKSKSKFHVKCNICGAERDAVASALVDGRGIKHGNACSYGKDNKYDHLKGQKIGDFIIDDMIKHASWWYAKGHCSVCGHEKEIRMDHLNDKLGVDHASCTDRMYPRRFYKIYWGMKSRCVNPKNAEYHNYGGRGIKCEWEELRFFAEDMLESYLEACKKYGEKTPSIDRIDVDGNYCKENCRWIPMSEQCANKRTTIYFIATDPYGHQYHGYCLGKFCREHNLSSSSMQLVMNGAQKEHQGWKIVRTTREEYLQFSMEHNTELHRDFWKFLNQKFDERIAKENMLNTRGIIVSKCEMEAYYHSFISPEMIIDLCELANPYNLIIEYDYEKKWFWVNDEESEADGIEEKQVA